MEIERMHPDGLSAHYLGYCRVAGDNCWRRRVAVQMSCRRRRISYAAFRLRARSDRVDRSDTIDTIATIAAETLPYPSRDRSDRIATIAEA